MNTDRKTRKKYLNLEAVEKQIGHFPMLPGVIHQLLQLDPQSEHFFEAVFQLARTDPPLACLILSHANSATSSPGHPIYDLREALTRIGSETVVKLVTEVSVGKVFMPSTEAEKSLWAHSVRVASEVERACQQKDSKIPPELGYICGLLHDLGRFVLLQFSPQTINQAAAAGWQSLDDLPRAELQLIGTTHAQIGYIAAKKMNLPKIICSLIKHHHDPGVISNSKAPERFRILVGITRDALLSSPNPSIQ